MGKAGKRLYKGLCWPKRSYCAEVGCGLSHAPVVLLEAERAPALCPRCAPRTTRSLRGELEGEDAAGDQLKKLLWPLVRRASALGVGLVGRDARATAGVGRGGGPP